MDTLHLERVLKYLNDEQLEYFEEEYFEDMIDYDMLESEQFDDLGDPIIKDKSYYEKSEVNDEVQKEVEVRQALVAATNVKKFADFMIAPRDLCCGRLANHSLDTVIVDAYSEVRGDMEQDTDFFKVTRDGLCDATTSRLYIRHINVDGITRQINTQAKRKKSRVYAEEEVVVKTDYEVTDDFLKFLSSLPDWSFAKGRFNDEVARLMKQ